MGSKRPGRITLRDVAEHAGVSVTTVSFVLSGRTDMRISEETADRVLHSARTVEYRAHLRPRAVPRRGGPVIGLVSDTVGSEAFAGEMIRGAVAAASERGHTVLLTETQGDPGLEASAIAALRDRGVERLLLATTGTMRLSIPPPLDGTPLVLLNCADRDRPDAVSVVPAEYDAGRRAARFLLDARHTDRIWLVGEVPRVSWAGRRRLAGIRAGLRAAGLEIAGHRACNWWPEPARTAVADLLHAGRPTAIVTMNDRIALGAYQAAAAAGMRVPADLSVLSFDDSDLARWMDPGLTSVALPHFTMGRLAVQLLLDDAAARGTHAVAMGLHARGSVAAPGAGGHRLATAR